MRGEEPKCFPVGSLYLAGRRNIKHLLKKKSPSGAGPLFFYVGPVCFALRPLASRRDVSHLLQEGAPSDAGRVTFIWVLFTLPCGPWLRGAMPAIGCGREPLRALVVFTFLGPVYFAMRPLVGRRNIINSTPRGCPKLFMSGMVVNRLESP